MSPSKLGTPFYPIFLLRICPFIRHSRSSTISAIRPVYKQQLAMLRERKKRGRGDRKFMMTRIFTLTVTICIAEMRERHRSRLVVTEGLSV